MDIQFEVQKIHSQFGTTEMANYQIQKLFDKLILKDRAEQLRLGAVVGQSEQLFCDCSKAKGLDHDEEGMPYCIECQKSVQ